MPKTKKLIKEIVGGDKSFPIIKFMKKLSIILNFSDKFILFPDNGNCKFVIMKDSDLDSSDGRFFLSGGVVDSDSEIVDFVKQGNYLLFNLKEMSEVKKATKTNLDKIEFYKDEIIVKFKKKDLSDEIFITSKVSEKITEAVSRFSSTEKMSESLSLYKEMVLEDDGNAVLIIKDGAEKILEIRKKSLALFADGTAAKIFSTDDKDIFLFKLTSKKEFVEIDSYFMVLAG